MSPPQLPNHHHMVVLQGDFVRIPEFNLPEPYTFTKTVYPQTTLANLHERIYDASILVLCAFPIDATALSEEKSPHLKLIVIVASGTDCVDLEVCRKRGIAVTNCPGANIASVSEHAMGLYFTTRRRLADMHAQTRAGEWQKQTLMFRYLDKYGDPPLTCEDEVVGIIGNGGVGKRIANLARGLGMKVLISGRKNFGSSIGPEGEDRTPFDTVIKESTVLFLAVPLQETTRNLISTPELEAMSHHAILINVSRGGVVDEEALVKALRENRIAGAATDVCVKEPAGPNNSPLLAEGTEDLNLVVTPHLAWLAQKTAQGYSKLFKDAVEGWFTGNRYNVVV
ncbi:D-isomer specific 2-hydroxyacid dehydrogenase [Aspergillus caelatus]|uniref:D-isomer specific 2-hydroxyacid dehydrogenase n=1 Tax=Aspergillus caelatus TaxID=61420 RepID=A0A5N7A9Q2_9EURO|nr:D-isomer specific 2-hydroxyacid dehydrogenase [Aspergillus caelatus]KAE8366098.1 D-isomer specific 2-hydroxyacid dehydrogenase [Aspergillus caelatus]